MPRAHGPITCKRAAALPNDSRALSGRTPALCGNQVGLKPLLFKMRSFLGRTPLINRSLGGIALAAAMQIHQLFGVNLWIADKELEDEENRRNQEELKGFSE